MNNLSDDHQRFSEETKNFYRYVEDYDWTHAADNFVGLETLLHRFRQAAVRRMIQQYAPKEGKCVDVGCGTALILRHLPAGSTGIDINPRNLEKAARYAPNAILVEGDVEAMPFQNNSFDFAVCTEVMEHVPEPKRLISEIHRILKPGSYLIGTVPYPSWIWKLRFLSSTHGGDHDSQHEPFHNEFTKKQVTELLHDFSIEKIFRPDFGMNVGFIVKKF